MEEEQGQLRRSPLADKEPCEISPELFSIKERPFTTKINIRGDVTDRDWQDLISRTCGLEFPLKPNLLSRHQQACLFCLGPNEWLLSTNQESSQQLIEQMNQACEQAKSRRSICAITDVSESRTIIEVSGQKSVDTLNKASPLNFNNSHYFPEDTIAQSYLGHAFMLYHKLPNREYPTFHLYPIISFASYVWDYLVDAAQEWQARESLAL